MDIVRIEKIPIEEMIRSAVETYRDETLGYLFGELVTKKSGRVYYVEAAHPVQMAKRESTAVESGKKYLKRACWSGISEKIGDYHSHTLCYDGKEKERGTVHLSKTDLKDLKNNPEDISLVIAINKTCRRSMLNTEYTKISGTVTINKKLFSIEIGGYTIHEKKKERTAIIASKRSLQEIFD